MNIEGLRVEPYGLSSLSEKTRKSNHLQMSLQRQHFLLAWQPGAQPTEPPVRCAHQPAQSNNRKRQPA